MADWKEMSKQTQSQATPRASDVYRCQMALNSVLQADISRRDLRMDQGSSEILVEYSTGLAEHLLGEAAKLAKHRGKNQIEVADLNLVLLKKMGMKSCTPDIVLPRVILHHESLGAGYGSMLHKLPSQVMINTEEGMPQNTEKDANDAKGSASGGSKKRKLA